MSSSASACNVDLSPLHTFHLPARAKNLRCIQNEEDLRAYALALAAGEPAVLLGEGSNTVFLADLPETTVWKMAMTGRTDQGVVNGMRCLRVGAGENWHDLVEWSVSMGHPGLENLALIPGSVGAGPVQNIGAYGLELKDRVRGVQFYDVVNQSFEYLSAEQCRFAYRDSVFKNELKHRAVIVAVDFALPIHWQPELTYVELKNRVELLAAQPTPQAVMQAVIDIRTVKLPDPAVLGNSGSFFKNPLVSEEVVRKMVQQNPRMPYFSAPGGLCKLAAGWLIEQCGLKGKTVGGVGVYSRQALILTNTGTGTGAQLLDLIKLIQAQVLARFGVALEPEPNLVGLPRG